MAEFLWGELIKSRREWYLVGVIVNINERVIILIDIFQEIMELIILSWFDGPFRLKQQRANIEN